MTCDMKSLDCLIMQLFFLEICFIASVLGFGDIIDFGSEYGKFSTEFETLCQWSFVNFTWETVDAYKQAIRRKSYIPENVMLGGIKFYEEFIFIALPKHRQGVPATLAYLPLGLIQKTNPLLAPYPSWKLNDDTSCLNLQSMLSMEIDTKGIMWAIDGVRMTNNVRCPPKLVLLDISLGGKLIHTYIFPNDICLQDGGFLNDIVVDETDGDFAYITDNSNIDPGIIVYSRHQNHAWKIRDGSIFAEQNAANFIVNNYVFSPLSPVDGIALSPKYINRTLYYTQLTGYSLYGINTVILKNEEVCRENLWRKSVDLIGSKEAQTDGMIMDSLGNLYYTLVPIYGVGKWNIFEDIDYSEIIYSSKELVWPDGFGMDQKGNLYLITTRAYTFIDPNYELKLTTELKFGIFKLPTGTRSYLFNDLL